MSEIMVEFIQRPYVQVLLFIFLTIFSIVIIKPRDADSTWSRAGIIFVGFMLVNSLFIWVAPSSLSYFLYSLGFSVVYLVSIAILIPAFIKLLKIGGAGESAMIFIFIIYHPAFLLFMLLLKWTYFKLF